MKFTIAYIYHWKCKTSKVRCTKHRMHYAEWFDVLYIEHKMTSKTQCRKWLSCTVSKWKFKSCKRRRQKRHQSLLLLAPKNNLLQNTTLNSTLIFTRLKEYQKSNVALAFGLNCSAEVVLRPKVVPEHHKTRAARKVRPKKSSKWRYLIFN